MQESRYKLNATRITCGLTTGKRHKKVCIATDFGISQVHFKNIERFHLDKDRLLTDLEYSVDAGAMIMSQYTKYRVQEPETWTCRYNVGTSPFDKIQDGCAVYLASISRWY